MLVFGNGRFTHICGSYVTGNIELHSYGFVPLVLHRAQRYGVDTAAKTHADRWSQQWSQRLHGMIIPVETVGQDTQNEHDLHVVVDES